MDDEPDFSITRDMITDLLGQLSQHQGDSVFRQLLLLRIAEYFIMHYARNAHDKPLEDAEWDALTKDVGDQASELLERIMPLEEAAVEKETAEERTTSTPPEKLN
jgi:hypothetical protein